MLIRRTIASHAIAYIRVLARQSSFQGKNAVTSSNHFIELGRTFHVSAANGAQSDDVDLTQPSGQRGKMTWKDLLAQPRVVILSGGGSGKTFEIRHRAKVLHDEGKPAFFLRIEHVRDDFAGAFDKAAGTHEQFLDWVKSGDEGWVFLDSVDEARLKSPKEFEQAINYVGRVIEPVLQQVHVVITGREAAWRARTDRELIRLHLPYESSMPPVMQANVTEDLAAPNDNEPELQYSDNAEDDESTESPSAPTEERKSASPEQERNAVLIVAFDTLSESQVGIFAQSKGVANVSDFLRAVNRREAQHDTARPLDLEGLIDYWNLHSTIGSQFELTEATINRRLDEVDQDRVEVTILTREQLRQGARVLAVANMLMQSPDIRLRDAPAELRGVEPRELLDWQEKDIHTLLMRPLFVASQFGAVRLYVQKAREFLTAEWLHTQLVDHASRARIEGLLFRTQYGREVVVPAMRGVLPWLALLDSGVLARVRRVAPEVMFEGGDPSRLPLDIRRDLLSKACAQLAASAGGHNLTDFQAVQRFAATDLADHIKTLLATYRDNNDVTFFLLRMVWQGEIVGVLDQAKQVAIQATDLHVRLIALRAVAVLGTETDRASIRAALLDDATPPEREWVAEALDSLPHDATGVAWLLQACARAKSEQRYSADQLPDAVEAYVADLPAVLLPSLVDGLQALVFPATSAIADDGTRVRQPYDWLIGAAIAALDRLVQAEDPASLSPSAMTLLLHIPTAVRLGDNENRKDSASLGEHVAAWQSLNRALFWADVEGTRMRRLKKSGESLREFWGVSIFGHYWQLGTGDFDYIEKEIATRPLLDDRLVALSVAYALYSQNGRPISWRRRLKRRANGVPELEASLDVMLEPPSAQVKQWRRQDAQWKRRSAREAAKRDADREKWCMHLQANLSSLRTPLPGGGVRQNQHYLYNQMRESDKSSSKWTDGKWTTLIPKFGIDVAEAFRDGAITFWRTNVPELLSTGATPNSTPVTTVFGLAGLLFESRKSRDWATRLTSAEAELAARYAMHELNGFPQWLPRLFEAHKDEVSQVLLGEIDYELCMATAIDSPSRYVLSDVRSVGSWLWPRLAPELLKRLADPPRSAQHLREILTIVSGSAVDAADIAAFARKHAGKEVDELAALWFAAWLGVEPAKALPALADHLSALPEKARQVELAMRCLIALTGGRFNSRLVREGYLTVPLLTNLYLLMQKYIVESDDFQRAGKGVYSPGVRDDAQDARDALLAQLRDTPGQEAYFALLRIAAEHPSENSRAWVARLAQARAVADADRPGWLSSQVREFQMKLERTPRNHQELHDLAIERLIDLKHSLEHGETSQAKLLLDQQETVVRNFVADWLINKGLNRYSIAQEEERAEGKRTDVRFAHVTFDNPVPVELKLANEWPGAVLVERMENQLCNDYLRDQKSSRGIFLLIYQGGRRHWILPDGTRATSVDALTDALQAHWTKVAKNFPHVEAVHVIGIDLTMRAKPMGRSSNKKATKKVIKKMTAKTVKNATTKSVKAVAKSLKKVASGGGENVSSPVIQPGRK
jgi:hypothetical protein